MPSPTAVDDPVDVDLVRQKFTAMRDVLRTELIERETEIDLALIALVARIHLFLLGVPGIAKTMLVDRLVMRIADVAFYSDLMFKAMPADQILGPYSIPGLKNEEFRRVVDGYIPWCSVALVDEVFKLGPATANALLGILLERRFRNNGKITGVPLSTAFLASNELPNHEADENLRAFWDRLDLRKEVHPPVDRASRRKIMTLEVDPNPAPILTWAEIEAAQVDARQIVIPDTTWDAVDEIIEKLRGIHQIDVSPRRWNKAMHPIRAAAWLAGAPEALPEHCEVLAHMLWETPDQARDVERVVLETVSPGIKAALLLSDDVAAYADNVDELFQMPASDRKALANELFDRATERLRPELLDAKEKSTGRALLVLEDAERTLNANHARLVEEAFGVDLTKLGGQK